MAGIKTPNIQSSQWIDSLLGNFDGSTRLIPLDRLIALLTALSGPTYATRAELYADRAWPANAIGRVYGDSTSGYNGVYKKSGASGSGSWTRIGELPSGSVETALIDALRTEMRTRRLATIWVEDFSGVTFPVGTDTVIQRQAGPYWALWTASDAATPGTKQQDATGGWWLRLWGSRDLIDVVSDLAAEVRNGRVFYINGTDPSGTDIPDWADVVIQSRTANNTFSVWRPTTAPANGLETADLKKTSNNLWFVRLYNLEANETSQKVRTDLGAALGVEAQARMDADNALAQSVTTEETTRAAEDTALRNEMRYGRVYTLAGGTTPSGAEIPTAYSVDLVICRNNAAGLYSIWRAIGAPSDGLETVTTKKDVNNAWWTILADEVSAAAIAALQTALNTEVTARTTADGQLRSAIRDGATIPLINVSGTGDTITADIYASFVMAGITTVSETAEVVFTPILPNTTTTPTLTIGTQTFTIRTASNVAVAAGILVVGRPYKLRRSGSILKIVSGDVTNAERSADRTDRLTNDSQMGTVTLESVGGTGDVITASVPSVLVSTGISAANIRRISWVQPASNSGAAVPTINIDGQGAVGIYTSDNVAPGAGHLVAGRTHEAVKTAGRWRIVSDVSHSDLAGTNTRVSGLEGDVVDIWTNIDTAAVTPHPGDGAVIVEGAHGQPLLMTGLDGTTRGRFRVEDIAGFARMPTQPGEYIAVLIEDASGGIVWGIDIRDGTVVAAGASSPATPTDPSQPGAVILPTEDAQAIGDAWAVMAGADGQIVYQSNQWGPYPIGYERRDTRSIAATKSIATGIVAFGGGSLGVSRTMPEAYPYHLFASDMGAVQATAAGASGAATLDILTARRHARPTTVAISRHVASTTEADAQAGSGPRTELAASVAQAAASMDAWGKSLFVDRIHLQLLDGAPATGELTADSHYAAIGNALRAEIADLTGQAGLPAVVVSQSAGTRTDGTSQVILAEGRLDWRHFALGFLIATPRYPFALEPGMPGTHTAQACTLITELEALAIATVQDGAEWYCPSLEDATITGTVISARFATLSGLVLGAGSHGFDVLVNGSPVTISSVTVAASIAKITLAAAIPAGAAVEVRYAWGRTGDAGDGYAANRGALRDSWSAPSRYVSGTTLYRYARSGRVTLTA